MNKQKRTKQYENGFTIMELMIVLGIIALIMGVIVVPRLIGSSENAKIQIAKTQMNQVMGAYELWSLNTRKTCPESVTSIMKSSGSQPEETDPWGQNYRIVCDPSILSNGKRFGLMSVGPDGQPDTDDDIKTWE